MIIENDDELQTHQYIEKLWQSCGASRNKNSENIKSLELATNPFET